MFNFQTWIRGPKRTFGTLFLLILRNGPFRIISVAGQSRRRLVSGRHTTCTIPWLLKRANRHWCVSGKAHDVHHTLLFTSNVGIGLCPEDTIHAPYLVFNNQNRDWLVSGRHTMCTRPCFLTIKVGIGLRTEDIRCAPCLVFNNQNRYLRASGKHTMCTIPCFLMFKVGVGACTEAYDMRHILFFNDQNRHWLVPGG